MKIFVNITVVFVSFWFSSFAQANYCEWQNGSKTVNLDISMGDITIDPDLPVGAVIKKQDFSIIANENKKMRCYAGSTLDGYIINLGGTQLNKVYKTNVPGVGISFYRYQLYPYKGTAQKDEQDRHLGTSTFTVTLYKIAEQTESGELDRKDYAGFGYIGIDPLLRVYIGGKGTNIITPSCQLEQTNSNQVYLSNIERRQLNKTGDTAAETPFSIVLQCPGGSKNVPAMDKIHITLSGDMADNTTKTQGVLRNSLSNAAAKGVGIQILDTHHNAITFDEQYPVKSFIDNQTGSAINLNYISRYYQYGDTISSGEVQSKLVFNLTYD